MGTAQAILVAFSLAERFARMSWLELVLWFGMASLTVGLMILMLTRWGQVRPVSKCAALSVFAHVLFLAYAYGTKLQFAAGGWGETTVRVSLTDDGEEGDFGEMPLPTGDNPSMSLEPPMPESAPDPSAPPPMAVEAPPMDTVASTPPETGEPPPLLPDPDPPVPTESAPEIAQETPEPPGTAEPEVAAMPPELPADPPPASADQPPMVAQQDPAPAMTPEPLPATENPNAIAESSEAMNREALSRPNASFAEADTQVAAAAPRSQTPRRPVDDQPIPEPYRLRNAENRLQLAIPFGATEASEAAVHEALTWLAMSQSPDGHWDASDFGAGRETKTLGHDRQGAGETADTGITGLALLALLGSGETHLRGQHAETVQRGLEYLIRSQAADGNLAGQARLFEKMYCHGIATLALSESYVLTGDPRLKDALERAVAYSLKAQHPTAGGWRYQPGDLGDISQFGWQVMALRSAELGGMAIPDRSRLLMLKFLDSATSGSSRGLASYRPRERPTRTMTAEALACRFFLGVPPSSSAAREATTFVLQEVPGQGQPNLYYYYYATLALFQDQGEGWQTWNGALQPWLVSRQRHEGKLAGSWDTDDVWGGYGGRVYTTAMATLCLEVYYRYLPLYNVADETRQAGAVRPFDPRRR